MKAPFLLLNYKAYKESLDKGIKIARISKKVSKRLRIPIVVAPQYTLIKDTSKIITTFSQNIDPEEFGSHTGSVLVEEVKRMGAKGTLINHSENRIPKKRIKRCVDKCRKLRLISVVCAKDSKESGILARFRPDFIAIEPPELIGGKTSVSTARPQIIKDSVSAVRKSSRKTKVLCGAGIHTKEDVKKAIELGAKGVLVASGIIKAKNIEKALRDIASGLL